MAQYYQIQNIDEFKQIYADVQVVQVAGDDVGQLLLQDEQILLNDGQQVVYQTGTANQPQYQQQATTQYIISDEMAQQQAQQQQPHQQLMLQQHQTIDQHQQQLQQQQQVQATQQHYVTDPQQQQTQLQAMQQDHHQLQHMQQQQATHQPQQQPIYYTTDQIIPQNTIVQQQQQQQQELQQQQIHVQHQQQQQQYQQQQQQSQQIVHQQHTMQSPQTQHQQVQVYRMQPAQQQQPTQLHQQPQMLNNAHVIVQQAPGQQLLIQSPQHQEIIMRQQQTSPQRSIVYNTNRVLYQSQPQPILQQSPQHHHQQSSPQQQQHIQLQTSPMHTRLVQARVNAPQQTQQHVAAQQQHQSIQQGVVFHQLQPVQKPIPQHQQSPPQQQVQQPQQQVQQQQQQVQQQQQQQQMQPQQPMAQQQLVNIANVAGMRGALRAKVPRGCLSNVGGGGAALVTRMTGVLPMQRATVRPMLPTQPTGVAQGLRGPRPRSNVTAGGTTRMRGAARGGRGGALMGGRGIQLASGGNTVQMMTPQSSTQHTLVGVQQQGQVKNITLAGGTTHQIKQVYRTQAIEPGSMVQQQQLQLVPTAQRPQAVVTPRFRTTTVSAPQHVAMTTTPAMANNVSGTAGAGEGVVNNGGGNYELDLEESIQAVVVKKEQQKIVTPVAINPSNPTTLTYYAKDDDENRLVRTQSGACMTLAEYKKRTAAAVQSNMVATSSAASVANSGGAVAQAPMRSMIAMRTPLAVGTTAKLSQAVGIATTCNQPIAVARLTQQPKMVQQQIQQQQQQQQPHQIDGAMAQSTVASSVHQTSHNNYEIQTQHVLQNRNGQQMAEKDRNSAKMLVILVSGEQRLITFTLPRESCTVQDLLEQVGVPFDNTTTIQCVENPGANIDFVVTVGFSVQESPSELISRAEQSLQMSRQQESNMAASQAAAATNSSGSTASTSATAANVAITAATANTNTTFASVTASAANGSEEAVKDATTGTAASAAAASKTIIEDVPRKVIPGFYAVCQICGFSGYDHAKCERCKRVFHDPPKRVPCSKGSSSEPLTLADKKRSDMMARFGKTGGPSYSASNLTSGTRGGRGGHATARGRSGRGGRRADAEPVILTLSSDEENDDEASNGGSSKMFNVSCNVNVTPVVYKELSFEPKMPEKDEIAIYIDFKRDDVTDLTNYMEKLSTTVQCRLIRIGTYSFEPQEPVTFTSKGIRMVAPLMSSASETCTLQIHKREVVKIIAHFSSTGKSMLCFYTLRKCAQYIKTSLNMKDMGVPISGPYFSPNGCYQMRKIILEVENITDHSRSVIKSIWEFLDEISAADAQDLLQRAAEADRQLASKNSDEVIAIPTTTQLSTTDIRQLLIYPSGKGGISIGMEDYLCLATDQYLNDIIIDFYLKWVHINVIPEQQSDKTFIFSTFFYKRLTTLTRHHQQPSDVKQTAAQKRHARVQNWTKNVNLFEKDFIIIPINEQSHWFLAIICFPKLKGPVTYDTNVPVEPQTLKKPKCKKMPLKIGNTTITPLTKRESTTAVDVCGVVDDDSERDEAEGDDSDLASEDSDFDSNSANNNNTATTSTTPPISTPAAYTTTTVTTTTTTPHTNFMGASQDATTQDEAIKQPLILIFDSLAGASRSRVVATLRDYLTCEYKAKMPDSPPHVFNKDNMPGHCVKVPQQNNFTDCGLYLLQYVEQFFTDPVRNYRIPIKQLTNWFDTLTVTRKREDISILLQKLMNEKNGPIQKLILPEIPFPTLNGQLVEPPEGYNAEFEEEEMEDEPADEEDDGGAVSGEPMDVDVTTDDISGSKASTASTPTLVAGSLANATITTTTSTVTRTTLVPSQGRKILFKRRMQIKSDSSSENTSPPHSATAAARSLLKIRKVEQ